jgi:hypothetical protein
MLEQPLHRSPATPWQSLDFFQNSSRIAQNLPRQVEELPVLSFAFLFYGWPLVA